MGGRLSAGMIHIIEGGRKTEEIRIKRHSANKCFPETDR